MLSGLKEGSAANVVSFANDVGDGLLNSSEANGTVWSSGENILLCSL